MAHLTGTPDEPRRIELLGGFEASVGARPVVLHRPAQRVLAFLALVGRCHRSVLAVRLWPDVSRAQALGSLRTVLWRLQGSPGWVEVAGPVVALHPAVVVDVHVLEKASHAWRRDGSAGGADIEELRAVLGLPTAELLPDWPDDWVVLERERLRETYVRALCSLGRALARRGRAGEAVDAAHRALGLDPLRESSHRLLVEVHLQEGDHAAAKRCYDAYRLHLQRELGLLPSRQMHELLERMPRAPARIRPRVVVARRPGASAR